MAFDDESLRRIKDDFANSRLTMGTCAKCGRNVVAENKVGQWIPINHDLPQGYRSGKRTADKRSGK